MTTRSTENNKEAAGKSTATEIVPQCEAHQGYRGRRGGNTQRQGSLSGEPRKLKSKRLVATSNIVLPREKMPPGGEPLKKLQKSKPKWPEM